MLRVAYSSGNKILTNDNLNDSDIKRVLESDFVWFHSRQNSPFLRNVLELLQIPERIVERTLIEQRTIRKRRKNFDLFVLHEARNNTENAFKPVVLIAGKTFCVTISNHSSACDEVFHEINLLNPFNSASLFAEICNKLTEYSFKTIGNIENTIWGIEEEILTSNETDTMKKIASIRRILMQINKVNFGFAETVLGVKKSLTVSEPEVKVGFLLDEVYDSLIQQIEIVNEYRQILAESLDAHNSKMVGRLTEANNRLIISSNRLNVELKDLTLVLLFLTIVSTIYLFPNTVATVLGVPSISSRVTGSEAIAAIVVSTVIPTLWILRQRWLKRLLESGFEVPIIPFIPFFGFRKKKRSTQPRKT